MPPLTDHTGHEINPLSRALRMRGRSLMRFVESLPQLRHGFGSVLAIAFLAGGLAYGSHKGGQSDELLSSTAAAFGLKASDIIISGQVETTEQEIFTALNIGGSLIGYDANAARKRVIDLPWVRDVSIRKVYPGKLTVAVREKRAMAVWQRNDRLVVVEKTGQPIAKFGIADLINNRFAHLPHLVGEGAAEAAEMILPVAAKYPTISSRAASYVRVAGRRWDIELSNGVRIKLPEFGIGRAMQRVAELDDQDRLLEREIAEIDLRLTDRVAIRLLPVAAKTRAELVSARLKAMKKADRKL